MGTEGSETNALVEVALALAMAFFSIMVLALVSMGGLVGKPAALPQGAQVSEAADPNLAQGSGVPVSGPSLLIYSNGRFFNSDLQPIVPELWRPKERPVLAVAPELSLSDVLAAKAQVPVENLTVTTLDERWLNRLKEIQP